MTGKPRSCRSGIRIMTQAQYMNSFSYIVAGAVRPPQGPSGGHRRNTATGPASLSGGAGIMAGRRWALWGGTGPPYTPSQGYVVHASRDPDLSLSLKRPGKDPVQLYRDVAEHAVVERLQLKILV